MRHPVIGWPPAGQGCGARARCRERWSWAGGKGIGGGGAVVSYCACFCGQPARASWMCDALCMLKMKDARKKKMTYVFWCQLPPNEPKPADIWRQLRAVGGLICAKNKRN